MAKKTNNLPDVVADALGETQSAPDVVEAAAELRNANYPKGEMAIVEVPYGEIDTKYPDKYVTLHLEDSQASALRRVRNGLRREGSRLPNGMLVSNEEHAIRWLLNAIG